MIHPTPNIWGVGINIIPTGKADRVLAYERADVRIKVPVAVVAQPDLLIPVLALQAKRLGHFINPEPFKAAQGVVGGRPDDSPLGAGQLLGQTVNVIVIVIELFVRVNDREWLEGALVIDVFAYLLMVDALGDWFSKSNLRSVKGSQVTRQH
jgi:hypothetical protein